MKKNRLLLTGVTGPFGVKDRYAEAAGMQMELLNNQITRGQGVHSPRQSYYTFPLYLLAENITVDTTVLDFPSWKDFAAELDKGYTHVGINFIVPNVHKARRMALHIRKNHPDVKILLGGYGTIIPGLQSHVPHDEACMGEGIRWLREYFGEDPEAPVKHPALISAAYEYLYGFRSAPRGSVLMPGVGCENGCKFCVTSHRFNKKYIPILETGRDIFNACLKAENETGARGFAIMDENFLKNPRRAIELLEIMERENRAYVFDIFSSAETIIDLGIDFLVRLGVRMVWIGAESKFYEHSKVKGRDLKSLIAELQSRGIMVNASVILFLEHHNPVTMREDIDWVIGLESNLVQFMNYTPYPTTALYQVLKKDGLLKKQDYRHQHGTGELAFTHPAFQNAADHARYLKKAFIKKYRASGPSVLNMALTAISGYITAREQLKKNSEEGLVWDSEAMKYVPSFFPGADEFLKLRVRRMQKIAMNMRPALLPSLVFSPNFRSAKKALCAMRLYSRELGQPDAGDILKSAVLVLSGALEFMRLIFARFRGRETVIRQPACRREKYTGRALSVELADINCASEKSAACAGSLYGHAD